MKVGDLVKLHRIAPSRAPGRALPYDGYPPGIVTGVRHARSMRDCMMITVTHSSGEELVWADYELKVINESR